MMSRLAPFAATVSLLGLLGWLLLGGSGGAGPERSSSPDRDGTGAIERSRASDVPCAAPLAWRIARVDPGFGIDVEGVRAAAEEAASLWEEAAGRRLFVHDSEDGFPIRLVYGELQERARERRRGEEELETGRRRLEADRRELNARREAFEAARDAHDERVREFRSRLSEHNAEVRRRNETGGASEEVLDALRRSEEALRRERRDLEEERRALEERARAIRRAEESLSRRIREFEREVDALARAFPPGPVEAGAYRETVREADGEVVSVGREIRVHRVGSREDLVRVLAHEMGHAQGLEHTPVAGSLMSEQYRVRGSGDPPAVGPADVELLRDRCPGL